MSETINEKQVFSLLEVTKSIQKTIAGRYKTSYWIKAELNKLNYYRHSGHCYPDLIEKADSSIVAQIRANLWKDDYQTINANFLRVLNEPLKDGIKILFQATISFHPQHGISLRIIDIDPGFTLGDLEKEKQDTLKKLHAEGIYSKNKQLQIPLLPQRIAIISVQSSKGYADFINVLQSASTTWNYAFAHFLFPSLLQGDNAIPALIQQLNQIRKVKHHFDVVAIVRGGGGDVGLSCYNNYNLAREIALFPLPVLTGIGHATNQTVAELVSFENAITPSKLAEFIIQKFHNFSLPVRQAQEKITDISNKIIHNAKSAFASELKLFRSATRSIITQNKNQISAQAHSLKYHSQFIIKKAKENLTLSSSEIKRSTHRLCVQQSQHLSRLTANLRKDIDMQIWQEKHTLQAAETNLINLSPQSVLKRGYSITRLHGKTLRSYQQVNKTDLIQTILFDGSIFSEVKNTSNTKDNE